MLDGAARLDELVAKAVADGQPAMGITDHGNMYGVLDFYKECQRHGIKPIIGTEAYMAHDSRTERPARRGRSDDSGGDTDAGNKLYYHLTLLAESNTGYRNLIQLASRAFLEGYYYKPRLDWELLADHCRRRDRHDGMPRRPRPPGLAARRRRRGHREGCPAAGDLRARQPVRRAAGPRHTRAAPDQPPTDRARPAHRRPAARHQRLALHPPRGPRGPRRPAVRADGLDAVGPQAVQVRRSGALPQDRRRDALPVPRPSRGVRQHAVDRRAGRRRHRVRQGRAARLPVARGIHVGRRVPRPSHLGGRPPALG